MNKYLKKETGFPFLVIFFFNILVFEFKDSYYRKGNKPLCIHIAMITIHPLMATLTSSIPLHVWFTLTLFITTRVCLIYNVITHIDILPLPHRENEQFF